MEIQLQSINEKLVVSSREVAENFGKRHSNVIRDLENIVSENSSLSSLIIESSYKVEGNNKTYKEYLLTKDGLTLYLFNIQGYQEFKIAYINKFNEMEKALQDIKFKQGDKKHQLECMERLGNLLPEDLRHENINYIKANTIVNKVVSDMYGFPKMLKKNEMNNQMLEDRENVLNDYLKLFEVFEDNSLVKESLNKKYKPKLLE